MSEERLIWAPCLAQDEARLRALAREFALRGVTLHLEVVEEDSDLLTPLQAKAYLVFVGWTRASVGSGRIRAEAAHALDRGQLYQALLDPVEPPAPIGEAFVFDLSDFNGAPHHEAMQDLSERLSHRVAAGDSAGMAFGARDSLIRFAPLKAKNWPSMPVLAGLLVLAFFGLVALAETFGWSASYTSRREMMRDAIESVADN